MKQELDEQLCKDFPLLYLDRHADMRTTCMCWGFPGDGWEPLIRELSAKLEAKIQKYLDENPDLDCECGCAKAMHDEYGCMTIHEIPYRVSPVWRSGGGWMATPKTLKDKIITLRKKARFYLFTKTLWRVQDIINRFLDFLSDEFGVHKEVPCDCEEYYPNHPHASQVKEKYGTLRFYMTSETEEMSEDIRVAEKKSEETCEDCGQPGKYRDSRYWVLTLCDKCDEAHDGPRRR